MYKDFFLKTTIGNFGFEIGKILGNFLLGLGPNFGPKSGPPKNTAIEIVNMMEFIMILMLKFTYPRLTSFIS